VNRLALAALLAAVLLWRPAHAADDPELSRLLVAAAGQFPGKMTAYVKHLATGRQASVGADEPMSSMSVIKLGILVKAYQMAEAKVLDLDDRVTLRTGDLRGGSGIFQFHAPGLNPTIRDLLLEMVITSDNTATEAMLARVGGVDELNRWFEGGGFGPMRMHSTIAAYFARVARIVVPEGSALDEREINAALVGQRSGELSPAGTAFALEIGQFEPWLGICARFANPDTWLGTVSARAVGRLLEKMETATLVSTTNSAEMMDMLKNQQAGARRIPMYLDTQYAIGHKTGDFPPCIANDVGVVYLKKGSTVMVFLTDQIRGNYGDAESRIGALARHVAEVLEKD
jgi:beta-lactamase class A